MKLITGEIYKLGKTKVRFVEHHIYIDNAVYVVSCDKEKELKLVSETDLIELK